LGYEEWESLQDKSEQFAGKLFDRLFEIARISNFTSEEVSEYETLVFLECTIYEISQFSPI